MIEKLGLMIALGIIVAAPASSSPIFIQNINQNANILTDTGIHYAVGNVGSNFLGGPGYQVQGTNSNDTTTSNYAFIPSATSDTITGLAIVNPTRLWVLLAGNLLTDNKIVMSINLLGTGGASQLINFASGSDIRDYYLGNASTGIDNLNTINNQTFTNASGHQSVGQSGFVTGTFVMDEHKIILNGSFAGQTLTSIQINALTGPGGINQGSIILNALTFDADSGTEAPEPGTIALGVAGLAAMILGRRRFLRA